MGRFWIANGIDGNATGINSRINVSNAKFNGLLTFTCAVWLRKTAAGGGSAAADYIFGQFGDRIWRVSLGFCEYTAFLWTTTDGVFRWQQPTLNVWEHHCFSYDYTAGTAALPVAYVNAQAVTVTAQTVPAGTATPASQGFAFGSGAAGSNSWFGGMAEAAIWNRVLGPAEVQTVYTNTPGAIWNGLVMYCPLAGTQSPEPNIASPADTGTITRPEWCVPCEHPPGVPLTYATSLIVPPARYTPQRRSQLPAALLLSA